MPFTNYLHTHAQTHYLKPYSITWTSVFLAYNQHFCIAVLSVSNTTTKNAEEGISCIPDKSLCITHNLLKPFSKFHQPASSHAINWTQQDTQRLRRQQRSLWTLPAAAGNTCSHCPSSAVSPPDTGTQGSLKKLDNNFSEPFSHKKLKENTKLVSLMSTYPSQRIRSLFLNLSRLCCLLQNKLKLQVASISLCWWIFHHSRWTCALPCKPFRTAGLQTGMTWFN